MHHQYCLLVGGAIELKVWRERVGPSIDPNRDAMLEETFFVYSDYILMIFFMNPFNLFKFFLKKPTKLLHI